MSLSIYLSAYFKTRGKKVVIIGAQSNAFSITLATFQRFETKFIWVFVLAIFELRKIIHH